jgi:hypothetical protein
MTINNNDSDTYNIEEETAITILRKKQKWIWTLKFFISFKNYHFFMSKELSGRGGQRLADQLWRTSLEQGLVTEVMLHRGGDIVEPSNQHLWAGGVDNDISVKNLMYDKVNEDCHMQATDQSKAIAVSNEWMKWKEGPVIRAM